VDRFWSWNTIVVAEQLGYLAENDAKRIEDLTVETGGILNGLIKALRPPVEVVRA
jgi:hypothetical protein